MTTTISHIETTAGNGYVTVDLRSRSVSIEYTYDAETDTATLNEDQFAEMANSDDVSLSRTERGELHCHLCQVAEAGERQRRGVARDLNDE